MKSHGREADLSNNIHTNLIKKFLHSIKGILVWCAVFSGAINILLLAGPLFMLQVYDRVIPSQSIPTLQALFVLIVFLYGFQASLEVIRSRVFSRLAQSFDFDISRKTFSVASKVGISNEYSGGSPFRDIDQIRSYLASGGPVAFFDIPWIPIYLALLYLLHPYLCALGAAGALMLIVLAWITNRSTRPLQREASASISESMAIVESVRRNSETVVPMGMTKGLLALWEKHNDNSVKSLVKASDTVAKYSGIGKFIRLSLQSLVLAVGAWLVINAEASTGVIVAASILQGRALGPIEQAIARWSGFVSAAQAITRINHLLEHDINSKTSSLVLPPPTTYLNLDEVAIAPPKSTTPNVSGLHFSLVAGDALGVIGASGSGKSSLARALVGVWPVISGSIRFDSATLDQWPPENSGKFIGYLPQRVELFKGTIGQNIARMDTKANSEDIFKAACTAGVDKMIRLLPDGFDTDVGEAGERLSAGQRQRIGLARALYKDPFFVVLDEPNSSLDPEGEAALIQAITKVRSRNGIVVVIAHRRSALRVTNKLLLLSEGCQHDFGDRDEVMKRVSREVSNSKIMVNLS